MNEMVERVAKALSIADGMHPDARSNDEDEVPMWTLYVNDARAAIAAMKNPSEEVRTALCKACSTDCFAGCDCGGVWDAGLDEALK